MTKKIVRLTESDLEKIVRRVIKESMGVGFMSGEPNGLKIKKMETKEQPIVSPTAPDQTKPLLDKSMLVVNQKLPLDGKTLATMASKLNGVEKSLIGSQFEEALKGVWGDDLINSFNNLELASLSGVSLTKTTLPSISNLTNEESFIINTI